jgi:hypothetical protein
MFHRRSACLLLLLATALLGPGASAGQKEPPALDPFGPRETVREDAIPGYLEMSDGAVYPGQIFLTREHRLRILDAKEERHRDVPLRALQRLDCVVVKEWLEKEWRFKENANDAKVYTGRSYPAREYDHVLTLKDGRKIRGALATIVYVQAEGQAEPERFLLHKRDRGETGTGLRALRYVRAICFGEKALQEGKQKAKKRPPPE